MQAITATPRQLEGLVRLSEALARMRLSPSVEADDVAEAIRLMKVPEAGHLNFNLINAAPPAACYVA